MVSQPNVKMVAGQRQRMVQRAGDGDFPELFPRRRIERDDFEKRTDVHHPIMHNRRGTGGSAQVVRPDDAACRLSGHGRYMASELEVPAHHGPLARQGSRTEHGAGRVEQQLDRVREEGVIQPRQEQEHDDDHGGTDQAPPREPAPGTGVMLRPFGKAGDRAVAFAALLPRLLAFGSAPAADRGVV